MLKQTPFDDPNLMPNVAPKPGRRRAGRNWNNATLVHFGLMVGLGFSGKQIGDVIGCGTNAVANATKRYGVQLARRRTGETVLPIAVSKSAGTVLDDAAAIRCVTRTELVERLISLIGEEGPQLVDSILDDGVRYDGY